MKAAEWAAEAGDRATLDRLADGRAAIRRAVLDALPADAQGVAVAEVRLFDRSRLVRGGARGLLERAGVDVLARYRDALDDPRRRAIAVAELGRGRGSATDVTADVALVTPFLADERIGVRAAAVTTLHALLGPAALDAVLPLLDDPAPGVVRAVGRVLRVHPAAVPMERLLTAAEPDRPAHVRRVAIGLIRERSGTDRLLIDLHTIRDPDAMIASGARDDLGTWLRARAARQARPGPVQLSRLADELERSRSALPPGWETRIAFHLGLRQEVER